MALKIDCAVFTALLALVLQFFVQYEHRKAKLHEVQLWSWRERG